MRRAATVAVYLAAIASVAAFGRIHAEFIGHYDFTGTFRFAWSLTYMALLAVAAYAAGIPDVPRTARQAVASALAATAAAAGAISVLQLASGSLLLPRYVVFWSAVALVPTWTACALVAMGGREREGGRDRVLAVVGPEERANLERDLRVEPEQPWSLAAVLDPPEAAGDGTTLPVADTAAASGATVVVLDRVAQADERVVTQAAALHEGGVRVRTLSLFYDEWLGKMPITELERVSLMFDIGELHRARYGRVKRLVDVVAGAAFGVALVALVPLILLGNAVANRGPLLFRQERVGKGGQPFVIRKLRTMRMGEQTGEWTQLDDPRMTPFGRLLRRAHLDELPQAINLLKGEVSLVGPRPEQVRYVEELRDKIPFYDVRHIVRPGITGWAQVKFGYAGSDADALEKLQYDFFYLRHQGIGLDARILARSVRSVAAMSGV